MRKYEWEESVLMKQFLYETATVVQEQALKFRYGMPSRSWRPLIPEGGEAWKAAVNKASE